MYKMLNVKVERLGQPQQQDKRKARTLIVYIRSPEHNDPVTKNFSQGLCPRMLIRVEMPDFQLKFVRDNVQIRVI